MVLKGKTQRRLGSIQNMNLTTTLARNSSWVITDRFSFLMLGLELSDSAMAIASGVRTYIFHVAAQPSGFSAA